MKLTLNGETRDFDQSIGNISELLKALDLTNKPVVVELNREPVLPDTYGATSLKNGDSVELVRIAAGG